MIASIIIGASTAWYFGVLALALMWGALFIFGYSAARCPHCGQVWWSGMGTLAVAPWLFAVTEQAVQEDETESFVCRRCRLDIGLGLRG
jgi:hypothetical protein